MKLITKKFSIAVLITALFSISSYVSSAQFPIDLGGINSTGTGTSIATDAQSNIYVTGTFTSSINFKSSGTSYFTLRTTTGLNTVYVAKLNSAGVCQWAFDIASTRDNNSNGIATDAAGNVYVTGSFQSTAIFNPAGGDSITAIGNQDAFVAKYNTSGAYQWAFDIGDSSSNDAGYGIATDAAGNVLVTGIFYGLTDFKGTSAGPDTINGSGSMDMFLAKYNSQGAYQWAFNLNADDYNTGTSVTTDADNNILVTGMWFSDVPADFKGTSGASNIVNGVGPADAFVAKYNSAGVNQWAFGIGSPGTFTYNDFAGGNFVGGIATDANNNVLVTGSFRGTANFSGTSAGPDTIAEGSGDTSDIFVAKYNSSGAFLWAFRVGSSGSADWGNSIATNTNGNVAVTGSFQGSADFKGTSIGPNIVTALGTTDAFVAEYNSAGGYQCAFNIGGSGNTDDGASIATDTFGNVLVTGSFTGSANFGLGAKGYQDAFVSKYTGCTIFGACTANAGANQSICQGVNTTATIGGTSVNGDTYTWSPAIGLSSSTVSEPTASPSVTTTYTITVTKAANGCLATGTVIVFVGVPPSKPAISTSGLTTFCSGESITMNTTLSYSTYSWSNQATTRSIDVTTGGTYSVTVTNSSGCSAASSDTTVTVNPSPATPVISSSGPTTFCSGDSITMNTMLSYSTYSWSNQATTQSIDVSTGGNYSVTVTNSFGCSASSQKTVTVNPLPAPFISASGPTTFCSGESITLNTTLSYSTYFWSNQATTQSIDVTTGGNYSVTVTSSFGCSAASSATDVTVNPSPATPVITQKGDTLFCSVTASSYQWYNDTSSLSGATGIFYLPSQSGSYKVSVTQGACSSFSSLYNYTAAGINTVSGVNAAVVLYPSPASSYFIAESKTTPLQTVTIYDVLGTRILSEDIKDVSVGADDTKARINIQSLTAGVYFVQLKTNNTVAILRIVKE